MRFEEEQKKILEAEIIIGTNKHLGSTNWIRNLAPLTPNYYDKCISLIKNEGLWLEFGVYNGRTINYISSKTNQTVYGFDCFEGIPIASAPWHKGHYTLNGFIPRVNKNVELIVGLFEATLDKFLKEHPENMAYIHVDCDVYPSTKTVFDKLKNRIIRGTVISFDEICNYPEYKEGELKAWLEFINDTGLKYNWVYRGGKAKCEQATCIIL